MKERLLGSEGAIWGVVLDLYNRQERLARITNIEHAILRSRKDDVPPVTTTYFIGGLLFMPLSVLQALAAACRRFFPRAFSMQVSALEYEAQASSLSGCGEQETLHAKPNDKDRFSTNRWPWRARR